MHDQIKNDPYARFLGAQWQEIKPGYARLRIKVTENMLNFLGYLHGGLLFSIADIAFAAASNMDYSPSLALDVTAHFVLTAKVGDEIEATAEKIHSTKRTGLYQMEVRNSGELLAKFTGRVFRKAS